MAVRDIVYLRPGIVLKSRIDHLHGSECPCEPLRGTNLVFVLGDYYCVNFPHPALAPALVT